MRNEKSLPVRADRRWIRPQQVFRETRRLRHPVFFRSADFSLTTVIFEGTSTEARQLGRDIWGASHNFLQTEAFGLKLSECSYLLMRYLHTSLGLASVKTKFELFFDRHHGMLRGP